LHHVTRLRGDCPCKGNIVASDAEGVAAAVGGQLFNGQRPRNRRHNQDNEQGGKPADRESGTGHK